MAEGCARRLQGSSQHVAAKGPPYPAACAHARSSHFLLHVGEDQQREPLPGAASLSAVAAAQQYTRLYDAEFLPRRLRRIKIFSSRPPEELSTYFHEKLNKANSNPRSIIKLYRKYIRLEDEPDYGWLVRCFCQLGNVFGFNSFWAPRDKQRIHSLPSFKFLVYDLIERKAQIEPEMVPRLLYALTALEYRSYHLLPTLLEHIEANLHVQPEACSTDRTFQRFQPP
ncbi:hypothetical protein cyc_04555 [Cyclospora cayetanensis]|uniref:DUF6832 domain-containing protein n=1 Tax=Cyclospora cayetanensis TaxID=88456 RepID=A0A1D3CXR6_9EIME|nr:hypothetical protein cyc_04555 [Cyclospora cayetanensis]